jgi:hypothetical protein
VRPGFRSRRGSEAKLELEKRRELRRRRRKGAYREKGGRSAFGLKPGEEDQAVNNAAVMCG